jgi:hypothetical protein
VDKSYIYFQEALSQIDFARRAYKEFEQALNESDVLTVFYKLHHFVIHVANVDKLLDPKADSVRNQVINKYLDFKDVDLKLIRRLRNHLEHFDERLDSWIEKHQGDTFFDMNIVTGAKGLPDKALRTLDGSTFKFYGEDFPLPPIMEEMEKLHSILEKAINSITGRN